MRSKLLLSSSLFFGLFLLGIITISLYQFDVIQTNKEIPTELSPASETEITDGTNSNSSSQVISFFSFLLNFSKAS
jgi:hypothetical protein